MSGNILIFFVLCGVSAVFAGSSPHADEIQLRFPNTKIDFNIADDAKLDVIGLLEKYGYPSETHQVETEDGYILTMHRIMGTKGEVITEQSMAHKPVAFLMHGLFSSSADWVSTGTEDGFGYLLADHGYDVWMGNARGNFYSRNHKTLNPDSSSDFWKFSWDEIGFYDLPAMIDRALAVTGKTKLHYAGHSQGTTSFFVMASRRPEYNNKIKSMHALAPIAYMSNLVSPLLRILAPFANTIELLTSLIGMNELIPSSDLITMAGNLFCNDNSAFQPVCSNFLFLLCGFNPDLHNAAMLPVLMGHTPAGASSRQLVHYGQEIMSGKFRRYDHGLIDNFKIYGKFTPPDYDLGKITSPVYLHYGDNDWMAAVVDVTKLHNELGNSVGMFRVPHDKFNHLDFIWAMEMRPLLYHRVVEYMRDHE